MCFPFWTVLAPKVNQRRVPLTYKTEHNAVGRFPEPGDGELLAGPSRNFQVFGPLGFLPEVTRHIPDSGEPDQVLRVVFEQGPRPAGTTASVGDYGHRGSGQVGNGWCFVNRTITR